VVSRIAWPQRPEDVFFGLMAVVANFRNSPVHEQFVMRDDSERKPRHFWQGFYPNMFNKLIAFRRLPCAA
jgi:hypothetical protein